MTTHEIFIIFLGDHINKRKSNIPSDVDWTELQKLARKHNVDAILYYQTKHDIFKSAYAATVYNNANCFSEARKLYQAIKDLAFFTIKGSSIACFYPEPSLRTMGDMDIMIYEKDREVVHNIVCDKLGYENTTQGKTVWNYEKKRGELEIHTKLINAIFVFDEIYEKYFESCWAFVNGHELDINYHMLFLFAHLRKHFMNSGVGIRQFMDIAVVTKNCELNWEWIESELNELNLLRFAQTVLTFNERWFGVMSPLKSMEVTAEEFESSTELILNNGVFGRCNSDNASNHGVNHYIDTGKLNWQAVWNKIFPSYGQLVSEGYAHDDAKVVVPLVWLKRIWLKRGSAKNVKNIVPRAETIRKREELYKQWGL